MRKLAVYCSLVLLLAPLLVLAQPRHDESRVFKVKTKVIPNDSVVRATMIGIRMGAMQPSGILNDRFGYFKSTGIRFAYKNKHNWMLGALGEYYFGKDIKEGDILGAILATDGSIITNDGLLGEAKLYARSYFVGATVGKLIPLEKHYLNTGIAIWTSLGYWQHKVRINNDDNIYSLSDAYKAGYDRLTSGIGLQQQVEYFYMSRKRLVNFSVGLDFNIGYLKGRRTVIFDTGKSGLDYRLDMMVGAHVSWFLPIFARNKNSVYSF